jgi:hypothetical protein
LRIDQLRTRAAFFAEAAYTLLDEDPLDDINADLARPPD